MDEKISVIMPVYNCENDIHNALNSLLNQSFGFENIEVIIVDDCSTDSTPDILKEYSNKYPNIKCFFMERNFGACGKGRNVGLEHASADYVMFLDSDDEFAQDTCEVMYSTITDENVDFVLCRYDMYVNHEFVGHNKSFLDEYEPKTRVDNLMDNLEMISTCSNFVAWNKIYNKEFILSNNMTFVDDRYNEDLLFGHEAYLTAENFVSLNHFFGIKYAINPDSQSNAGSEKYFDDGLYALGKIDEIFKAKNFEHYEVLNEYLAIWTQGLLTSDMEISQKKYFFRRMKPYYKRYGLFYRLINKVSLPFNIAINIFIKLFSISESFAAFTARIYKLILG